MKTGFGNAVSVIASVVIVIMTAVISPAPGMRGEPCALETRLAKIGLVDVRTVDPSLIVELKYSTRDNFMGRDVYGCLERCYLQPDVALMLKRAHDLLKVKHPYCRFVVYDGARPRSVQKIMWAIVKASERKNYVVPPWIGSNHNYGAAVDLSLAVLEPGKDAPWHLLDMGTVYDHLGTLAEPRREARYLKEGRLTAVQVENRRKLREAMMGAGFRMIPNEWWHFDAFHPKVIRARYRIIE